MTATRPSCRAARRPGSGTRQPGRLCDGRDSADARGRDSSPSSPTDPDLAWLVNGLAAKYGTEPSEA